MKKTYWWRILLTMLAVLGVAAGYVIFYPYKYGLCVLPTGNCILSAYKKIFAEPVFIFSSFALITSLFLFFISDKTFLKWLRFALIWMVISIIFIIMAPVYSGGYLSYGPTKESVSIWMGGLFVILSLAQFIWEWHNSKK